MALLGSPNDLNSRLGQAHFVVLLVVIELDDAQNLTLDDTFIAIEAASVRVGFSNSMIWIVGICH